MWLLDLTGDQNGVALRLRVDPFPDLFFPMEVLPKELSWIGHLNTLFLGIMVLRRAE
jgi:hypothetical protein